MLFQFRLLSSEIFIIFLFSTSATGIGFSTLVSYREYFTSHRQCTGSIYDFHKVLSVSLTHFKVPSVIIPVILMLRLFNYSPWAFKNSAADVIISHYYKEIGLKLISFSSLGKAGHSANWSVFVCLFHIDI